MLLRCFITVAMVLIASSLFRALYYLVRGNSNGNSSVTHLTRRICLSLSLFAFLILACCFGWIQPHGLIPPP